MENIIGGLEEYSRVEQPLLLLVLGCEKSAEEIFVMEVSATITPKQTSQKLVRTNARGPSRW